MSDLPESGAWQRTSPFAIVFFVGTTARKIIDGYGQVAATVGVTAFLLRNPEYAALVITIGSVALLTVAFLRYWCFRFRIDEDRILIREGVLRRKALDLPFSRIQGVNIQRRLSERVLGLVTVVLDTPGSIAAEGQLRTVKPEVADQLLAKVAAHRHGLVAGGPPTVTESAPWTSANDPPMRAKHRQPSLIGTVSAARGRSCNSSPPPTWSGWVSPTLAGYSCWCCWPSSGVGATG